MDGFSPPLFVVRVLLTCALGETTALRANATHEERERQREERGPLVAAQNSRSQFSSQLQPARMQNRNRVVSILYCRFLFFSFFKNILSIMYFGHLASSPNCAILWSFGRKLGTHLEQEGAGWSRSWCCWYCSFPSENSLTAASFFEGTYYRF